MTNYQINKVLVPMDFSSVALNALQSAIAICKKQMATLTLIHIVENSHIYVPHPIISLGTIQPELIKIANDNLNNIAKELRLQHDLVVNHIVQAGNVSNVIVDWAIQHEIDLIVMGTNGTSGLAEFFLGSNAYRIGKSSPCPILTVPGNNQWTDFKKILFPVRMVPNALRKYDVIRPIVQRNGSSLQIAGIVQREDNGGLFQMGEMINEIRGKVLADNVVCGSSIHYCEDVAQQVLDISEQEKPDLIVITATLDASLKDFFNGPYTQAVINHAKFPVLSVRQSGKSVSFNPN